MYEMKLCFNGSKRQVYDTLTFETKREWRYAIDTMPFDVIDETDTVCYVDYGDNDDWDDDMVHTVPNGTTYTIRKEVIEEGFTGRVKTIWTADNFAYYAETREDLFDLLDYMTETWIHQSIS